ncbi:MAG TPA: glycosyltransferase family 1 protein [Planctomycetota bacterium]|nr:glycosyltransferase family 1 protein [Planctomycetota bacterium]
MARIALDCRSVFPGMGGIGRYAATLAGALPQLDPGNEYHFLVTDKKADQPLSAAPNASERPFACGMIDERWEQLELPGELAGMTADLYHSTCFTLPVAGGARRKIATVHDVIFSRHPELVDERLRNYLDRWTEVSLDVADRIITVSEFSKREMCELYGADPGKVRVVYNGVDPRFAQAGAAATAKTAASKLKLPKRYALYVGALEEKKNIPRLLAAWKLVSAKVKGLKLVLAGGKGGKGFDAEAAVKAVGVDDSVVLAGYVADSDLPAVMAGAEIFVYPSLYEGFGLPVLEAMACGVPVVTSKTSSLGEIAGDAARLVDPESVEDLAGAMEEVVADRKLAQSLVKKGRARAAEFTPDRCARETLAVYREVLS